MGSAGDSTWCKYGEDLFFCRVETLLSYDSFPSGSTNGSIGCGIDHV